jgi:hypothetical protein
VVSELHTNEQGQLELEVAQTLNDQVCMLLFSMHVLYTKNGQVFHDEFGGPNLSRDAGLKLELRDFAPQDLARGISGSFLIDSATLCRFLNEAEQEEQEAEQERGVIQRLLPGAKKRRREKTPPEDINSEDDRRHVDNERMVRARASADDSSYKYN